MKALALTANEAAFVNVYQAASNFSLFTLNNEETAAFYSLQAQGGIIKKDGAKGYYEIAENAVLGLEKCHFIGK